MDACLGYGRPTLGEHICMLPAHQSSHTAGYTNSKTEIKTYPSSISPGRPAVLFNSTELTLV